MTILLDPALINVTTASGETQIVTAPDEITITAQRPPAVIATLPDGWNWTYALIIGALVGIGYYVYVHPGKRYANGRSSRRMITKNVHL